MVPCHSKHCCPYKVFFFLKTYLYYWIRKTYKYTCKYRYARDICPHLAQRTLKKAEITRRSKDLVLPKNARGLHRSPPSKHRRPSSSIKPPWLPQSGGAPSHQSFGGSSSSSHPAQRPRRDRRGKNINWDTPRAPPIPDQNSLTTHAAGRSTSIRILACLINHSR